MNAKDAILNTLAFSDTLTKAYLAELTAADLLIRPVPGMNHMAWQLGHLIMSERDMLDKIRPESSPKLPEGFEEGHAFDKKDVDDPSKYHAPEDYLKLMSAQREATQKVLAGLDQSVLDAPSPEGYQQMAPDVGAVFMLMGNHYLMHAGQWVAVRRLLNKPIAF